MNEGDQVDSVLNELRPMIADEIKRIAPLAASPYLNRPDAAAWFGCSVSKIDQLRMDGRVKAKYLGDQPMFLKTDIESVMREDTERVRQKLAERQMQRG